MNHNVFLESAFYMRKFSTTPAATTTTATTHIFNFSKWSLPIEKVKNFWPFYEPQCVFGISFNISNNNNNSSNNKITATTNFQRKLQIIIFLPVEKVKNFRPFIKPQCVFGISLPHKEIFSNTSSNNNNKTTTTTATTHMFSLSRGQKLLVFLWTTMCFWAQWQFDEYSYNKYANDEYTYDKFTYNEQSL